MENDEKKLSRRSFLSLATYAIGGIISIGVGIPAIAYLIGPSLQQKNAKNWIRLSPTSKVEVGTPTLFKINVTHQVGWTTNEEELAIYVLTENGRDFVAISNVCTHLGCRVRWISDKGQYFCPCHNGVFDKAGQVVSGPPPRGLDRYQVKVENDQLYILGG
jgi:menaquinol-cytochrome c reductase iron-sulfur subunit